MPAEPSQAQANPVAVGPGNAVYDEFYYAHYCGDRAYSRDAGWLHFFGSIAQEIVARISPRTVLDAGCAMGMVVEALRDRGVEAYGVDVSDYAIANARQDVRMLQEHGSFADDPRRDPDRRQALQIGLRAGALHVDTKAHRRVLISGG